ncbi:MAG: hypothetical protein ACK4K7_06935 [Allosphingosinicella sp.]|uniref:hypothetical protein n=1 Tax=Allosphingosinicella sp. TaxID=2823234 RepID=UPI00394FBBB7
MELAAVVLAALMANGLPGQSDAEAPSPTRLRIVPPSCRESRARADGDQIVVCAPHEDPRQEAQRLPLPVERPPRPADIAGGEQAAAMDSSAGSCRSMDPGRHCNQGLNVLAIGGLVARGVQAVLRPGEEED